MARVGRGMKDVMELGQVPTDASDREQQAYDRGRGTDAGFDLGRYVGNVAAAPSAPAQLTANYLRRLFSGQ